MTIAVFVGSGGQLVVAASEAVVAGALGVMASNEGGEVGLGREAATTIAQLRSSDFSTLHIVVREGGKRRWIVRGEVEE